MNRKVFKITAFALFTLLLFSCSKLKPMEQASNSDNVKTSEVNNTSVISPIANEDWFKNDIHMLYNTAYNTHSLVKGDGTILLTTIEPSIENIGKIDDVKPGVTNYIYKNYTGENYIKMNISNTEEEFIDARPTQNCIVYDKNGKEIGLSADMYSPSYSSSSKIIYATIDGGYGVGGYFAFDVNTKENKALDCDLISIMNEKFLLSTSPWNEKNDKEVIHVCDENLDIVKTIDGYSLDSVTKTDGVVYASLRKKVKGKDDFESKYNFLDSNFDLIFENDIDERIWTGNQSVLTLRTGNTVINYDFVNKTSTPAENEYKEKVENEAIEKQNEEKYSKMENRIKEENVKDGEPKYYDVTEIEHDGKVLYLAHLSTNNRGMFDYDPIDVYNEEGGMIGEFDDLSNYYREQGYLFVNHETVYNINMQVVRVLKEKRNIERVEKFGKVFFCDRTGLDYSSVKPFTLYNELFEPIYENLEKIETGTYDDYIVIIDSEGTKLLDKDFNVTKTFDRKLDIKSWYDNTNGFKAFEDVDTERMGIIDKDYNIVVDKLKHISMLEEKYFSYQNGFEYGLMDYEGRPIFKYSIFSTMTEDSVGKDYRGEYVIKYDDYD